MDISLAGRLVALTRRAYALVEAEPVAPWQPPRVDAFTTPAFSGFVASDARAAYMVFRGTKLQLGSRDNFLATIQAWLANLDYAQVEEDGGRVHRGYARELDHLGDGLAEMVQDHALGGKPIYLTGHSAGGALATLAARRLHAKGVPVRAAIVFAAPRVGDRRFAASYPLPLVRIEHRHDLVPHLPLPPSLARIVGNGLVDRLIDTVDWLAPALGRYRLADTEYVHAGQLFYDDGSQALYRIPPGEYLRRFGGILRDELKADLLGRGAAPEAAAYRAACCPSWATPLPGRLMDGVRLPATLGNIARQLREQRLDFLLDHHIDGARLFVERVERLLRGG